MKDAMLPYIPQVFRTIQTMLTPKKGHVVPGQLVDSILLCCADLVKALAAHKTFDFLLILGWTVHFLFSFNPFPSLRCLPPSLPPPVLFLGLSLSLCLYLTRLAPFPTFFFFSKLSHVWFLFFFLFSLFILCSMGLGHVYQPTDLVQSYGLRPALISFMQSLADSLPELNRKIENMMLDTITNVIAERPYTISLGEFAEVEDDAQVLVIVLLDVVLASRRLFSSHLE